MNVYLSSLVEAVKVKLRLLSSHMMKGSLKLGAEEYLSHSPATYYSKRLTSKIIFMNWPARLIILLFAALAAGIGLLHPWIQRLFIDELTSTTANQTVSLFQLSLYSFFAMLTTQLFSFCARVLAARESGVVNMFLSRIVYSHTLNLTAHSRSKKTIGEIVNYYAQDVSAAAALIEEFLVQVFLAAIPLIFAPIFAWKYLGVPFWSVTGAVIVVSLVMLLLSWRQSRFFGEFKRLASQRLSIVNEWLQNIRIIRVLGWTEAFERRIKNTRIVETDNRISMVTNGSSMNSFAQVAPVGMTIFTVYLLATYSSSPLTGGSIFALFWIFGVFLSRPIRMMPWNLVIFMDGYSSCKRLESFFKLTTENDLTNESGRNLSPVDTGVNLDDKCALSVRGLSLQMGNRSIFRGLDLIVKQGSFIVIVGEVGSGKTQLLMSLLRENLATWDTYSIGKQVVSPNLDTKKIRKRFSFVPQDGFVISSTLLENIVFNYSGLAFDEAAALHALKVSCFDLSNEGLTNGLITEIGERGVNLSGGQKQRIGLSRAVYHARDIILMDDCFSAIDPNTEEKLIRSLVCGEWRSKTRILVTHRLSVIPFADQVFELRNGVLHELAGKRNE